MNCIFSDSYLKKNLFENATLFAKRFPELSYNMHVNSENGIKDLAFRIPENYILEKAKSGNLNTPVYTACINGKFIHSKYNPIREAEQALLSPFFNGKETRNGCVFYGLGLGYLPEIYAARNTDAELLIVEPDIFLFLLFLASRPLCSFFTHKKLILLLGAYPNEVLNFFEKTASAVSVFKQTPIMDVNHLWFSELEILQNRRNEKNRLNKNTFKKFGKLWTRNFFKNVSRIDRLINISEFENSFNDYPSLIIAAGPSLTERLSLIKKYKDKFIIIAADTAVSACIREGITPDFILLMDAQYWNYLHLAEADITNSVLVTELAVYPAVFRLKTLASVLASSACPLAQYAENAVGGVGKIASGGSVATACWDFARFLGSKEIIAVGLDLAFPQFQTHFKGSRFEEDTYKTAMRFHTAEDASHRALYSAYPETAGGYDGNVLTDMRMKMYAWWFESKIAEYSNIKTFNLIPCGLKIPNMIELTEDTFVLKSGNSRCSFAVKRNKIKKIIDKKNYFKLIGNLKYIFQNLEADFIAIKKLVDYASVLHNQLYSADNENTGFKYSLLEKLNSIDETLKNSKLNAVIGFDILLYEKKSCNIYDTISENIKNLQKILKDTE